MLTLVTGGARSGKSRHAQALASKSSSVLFVATALRSDEEMEARIVRHREDRPSHWQTVEEPLHLAAAVSSRSEAAQAVLIDCLTVWLSNLCWRHREQTVDQLLQIARTELDSLICCSRSSNLTVVTNEVGSGIVPEGKLARDFRDLQGFCNQHLARAAEWVYLVVSGIPVAIKSPELRTAPELFHQ
jgi:adenosylcobinamide kinase/adenosylcobinamide-phosphate guanylyltransferase